MSQQDSLSRSDHKLFALKLGNLCITPHSTLFHSIPPAGGEDDAAQLLSNEHALARNNVGMVPEHGTPLSQQNTNVGPPPSAAAYQQVTNAPLMCLSADCCMLHTLLHKLSRLSRTHIHCSLPSRV